MKKLWLGMVILFLIQSGWAVYHKISDINTDGQAMDVFLVEHILYVADGDNGMLILDVNDIENPLLLGSYQTIGNAFQVQVHENMAFLMDENNFYLINISNPENSELIGSISSQSTFYDFDIKNSYAYVVDYSGLSVYDISNQAEPVLIHFREGDYNRVKVNDSILFLTEHYTFLQLFDISNPETPLYLSTFQYYDSLAEFKAIQTDNQYTYLLVSGEFSGEKFLIVDFTDPQNGEILSEMSISGYPNSIEIIEQMAYVTNLNGVQTIDISNPYQPVEIGFYKTDGHASGIQVSDSIAFIADENRGIQIIDVENPENPYLTWSNSNSVFHIDVRNDILFTGKNTFQGGQAGTWETKVQLLDVTNPSSPQTLSQLNGSCISRYFSVLNDFLYITEYDPEWNYSGFRIVDISNPQILQNVSFYEPLSDPGYFIIANEVAYIIDETNTLKMLDISDNQNPQFAGSFSLNGTASMLQVKENIAYIANNENGLLTLDVSNPQELIEIGNYQTTGEATYLTLSGNALYLTDSALGLLVLDITNPSSPLLIDTIKPHLTSRIAYHMRMGSKLYVSDMNWNEIFVFDITNPINLSFITSYKWNLNTYGIAVESGYLYTTNWPYGWKIHDLEAMGVSHEEHLINSMPIFRLMNFPNPFNPSTTIQFSSENIAENEQITLEIFNLKGQKVRQFNIQNSHFKMNEVVWDGNDNQNRPVSSGIYLYQIKTREKVLGTEKMLLLK